MRRLRRVLLLSLLSLAGCFGGTPDPPRYFQPELPQRKPRPRDATKKPVLLELAAIRAADHLKDRIVWRKSDVEFGFYDQERWTEPPASYLERSLGRELFERRGMRRAARGAAFALHVQLQAFEEVLLPKHQARVRVAATLLDGERVSILERTLEVVSPIQEENSEAMVRALGKALDELVTKLAEAIDAAIAAAPAPENG